MATATLSSVADKFPVGTTVTVYPLSNWPTGAQPPAGAPIGSSATTAVVASAGSLAFTGLTEDTRYVATASVGGTYRYVHFTPTDSTPSVRTASGLVDQDELVIPKYDKDNGQAGTLAPSPGSPAISLTAQAVAANTARIVRFVPSRTFTATKIGFAVTAVSIGDTADPAVDVALYSSSLVRLVSSGATTGKLTTTGAKTVDITATELTAGTVYYAALSVGAIGTTTASLVAASTVSRGAALLFGTANGVWETDTAAASHPLPNPFVPAGTSGIGWLLAIRES
jgi:hypothetical protein